jgi:carboxyl-terminal processing protease
MNHSSRRVLTLTVVLFAGSVVAAPPPNAESVGQSLKSFSQFYSVVEQNFADSSKVDNAIYEGAIPGMLSTLDPHSHFFDPKEFASMQEDQRETYFGTGMTVRPDGKRTLVVAPFSGSPAYKAGLRPGDAIVAVDGKSTDGMDTNSITVLLKGPRGTHVRVSVARTGVAEPITVDIIRDEIPRPSVSEAFWLRPGIAYVRVNQFKENTSKELEDNLHKLGENEIQGLVLDLRENPGGLLFEGIQVAGHFLKRNQVVVSDRGRVKPTTEYSINKLIEEGYDKARSANGGKEYPVVVVVNRHSASAAEIVSGALQDHDRGWILGETTFGKGLVQEVLRLSDNTALSLTTMHYYTPSGRLIQRDYSNISFLQYSYSYKENLKNLADEKTTDSGRTVFGGGGITPDEKYTAPLMNKFQIETLLRKYSFFKFSAKFFGPRADPKLPAGWVPDEQMVNDFHQFLLDTGVSFTEAEFTENHQWVKDQLKREMYITGFNVDASDRVQIEQDPEVVKAVEAMPKAKMLLENAKKVIVKNTPPAR